MSGKMRIHNDNGKLVVIENPDTNNTNITIDASQIVTKSGSVTDNAVARYDSATGKLQNSGVIVDDNDNVGIGVTPSAWSHGKALEIAYVGNFIQAGNSSNIILGNNSYYNSGWKYANSGAATNYTQVLGAHQWFTAPSGTAGNPITWTNAMTLDSEGILHIPKGTKEFYGLCPYVGINSSYHVGSSYSQNITNLDNLKVVGKYNVYPTVANQPLSDYGFIDVYVHSNMDEMYNPSWVVQVWYSMGVFSGLDQNRMFIRSCVAGTWTAWVEK